MQACIISFNCWQWPLHLFCKLHLNLQYVQVLLNLTLTCAAANTCKGQERNLGSSKDGNHALTVGLLHGQTLHKGTNKSVKHAQVIVQPKETYRPATARVIVEQWQQPCHRVLLNKPRQNDSYLVARLGDRCRTDRCWFNETLARRALGVRQKRHCSQGLQNSHTCWLR